ncbi:uncharacterized protein FPRO_15921 [Fusarium proliferatum ET1]|uniref:Uncharacterized protein n=1 Tax=Fusarium proliferatum (strain ET1) TaxID=1227346 RepID=A0A1L7WAC5_FUSPR|nr:uncharacterized protein FPRO_15921 [Fusarium proliferatum ET1]CVL12586.1 uncharacterized protein FPRN_15120 [Fusarium proliferatum]CZR49562.1 uncharacterized protein FPRO_15921 [Fusarium proliferatum ET1]
MEYDFKPDLQDVPSSIDRPTHKLKNITVGECGVQLLLSTRDHLYDAENVEAGNHSWQVVGAWEESSVKDLAQMLGSRQAAAPRQNAEPSNFKTGTGKKLGVVNDIRR